MLYIGTSSYSLKEWAGSFYPLKMPPGDYLAFYASRLNTVEINYTYRHFPTVRLSTSWADETPESFRFSFKVHQTITHIARLRGIQSSVYDFVRNLEPLGPRLGVILFQLPPTFRADHELLKEVLEQLPPEKKFAFEFRHPSWNSPETLVLLEKAGAALCDAETEITHEVPPVTAAHVYIRLRGVPPYSTKEMASIETKIEKILKKGKELYLYIKHDTAGLSPQVAMALQSIKK